MINVYLPTTANETEFDNVITDLSGVLGRLLTEGVIVIAGDFNASLHRSNPTSRDKKFKKFVEEAGLVTAVGTTGTPTYHGNNGTSSKIDYALVHQQSFLSRGLDPSCVTLTVHECLEETPDNHSTHDLWGFDINIKSDHDYQNQSGNDNPKGKGQTTRIDWENIDVDLYPEHPLFSP